MRSLEDRLFRALTAAGLPEVPQGFSVVPHCQVIPEHVFEGIAQFIRVFDRVTMRQSWQATVTAHAPDIARTPRTERCFFSAWDFHVPQDRPGEFQLIEFNDNGSGFLFAGLINDRFHRIGGLARDPHLKGFSPYDTLADSIGGMAEAEFAAFYGAPPAGLFLILDDEESLTAGRFRREHDLLADIFRRRGWPAAMAAPSETTWDGRHLLCRGAEVAFVVNRSTDFFWESDPFAPLRNAYRAATLYVAPNPFTYATRSDKRLLAFLSRPLLDAGLGIRPDEREYLSAHVPETHLIGDDNVDAIADKKDAFFFKPIHGYAGRGVIPPSAMGRSRLRRLVRHKDAYVAQKRIAKSPLKSAGASPGLWADLRVWAYRGDIFLLSGRASRDPDRLDLTPPGGWIPTYVRTTSPPQGAGSS